MRLLSYFGVMVLVLGGPVYGQAPQNETAAAAFDNVAPSSAGIRIEDSTEFRLLVHGTWQQTERGETIYALENRGNFPTPRHVLRSGKGKTSNASLTRRSTYLPWVSAAEARHALPAGLLDALIWTESRYNPFAVSNAGAAGLGQLMPGTARDLGVFDRFDPKENVSGAARYLKQMLDRFGMVHLALAAYNAGPGAVQKAKGIPLNNETPGYVRSVLKRWGLQ